MKTTCEGSIAPGASCAITANFTAKAEGVTAGTVTILDSASSKPQVVEMLGTGTGVKLTPAKLTFPAVKVGTQSQPETIQLTNIGSAPLDFTRTIYIGGLNYTEFFESDNCGTQIDAGASCTISITFKPRKTGTRTANVTINDNGGGSPQTVQLSGTGD
jgi:Cep192 domain 4